MCASTNWCFLFSTTRKLRYGWPRMIRTIACLLKHTENPRGRPLENLKMSILYCDWIIHQYLCRKGDREREREFVPQHGCIKENSHQGLQHDHYWGWDAPVEVQILISVSNRTQRDKTKVKCISKGCRSRITRIVVLCNTQPHEREQRVDEDVNQTSDRYRGECRKIHDRMIPIVPKFCSPSQSILSLYICRTARLIIWMLSIEDSTCVRVLVKTFEEWVFKRTK
jgi:hypothetical protein